MKTGYSVLKILKKLKKVTAVKMLHHQAKFETSIVSCSGYIKDYEIQ